MAVNYVKGQILSSILERDGNDLSIVNTANSTPTLYIDIANSQIGINTDSPASALDVFGNIQANNFNTTGSANTGNITGANVISSVTLCAFGNINGGNLNISANVATGNLLTDNLLYANGTPWDLQQPAGSNTEIQFNNNSQFGANANFTFDTTANLLVVNATANIANINITGDANVQGNITGGNLLTNSNVSVAGNVTGNYFFGTFVGNISGNLSAPGSNTQVIYNNNGNAGASSGFTFDQTSNAIVVAGNITSANINILGGNISSANVIFGNTVSAVGNSYANIFVGNTAIIGTVSVTGNVVVGNIFIPAVGNINAGNVNINNLSNPVANQDAATKYYVDQSISNIAVTNQILYGNSVATTFTLDRSTTTAAVLVILNGITQVPGQAYDMVPSPSANLVFSEAPSTSDVIDIRFL